MVESVILKLSKIKPSVETSPSIKNIFAYLILLPPLNVMSLIVNVGVVFPEEYFTNVNSLSKVTLFISQCCIEVKVFDVPAKLMNTLLDWPFSPLN